MILSSIKLYNSLEEVSILCQANYQLFDNVGLTTTYAPIPTGVSIFWTICAVNPETLSLVDSDLQDIAYWNLKKWDWGEYPLSSIIGVSGKNMDFYLTPRVTTNANHYGITPYLEGGTSLEVFISGVATPYYNLTGRHLSLSNEVAATTSVMPSGSLYGLWLTGGSPNVTSGADVAGEMNYLDGHITLDFTGTDYTNVLGGKNTGLYPSVEGNTIYIKWEGNYDAPLFSQYTHISQLMATYNPSVSTAKLKVKQFNDTDSYYISVSVLDFPELLTQSNWYDEYIFHPRRIALLEDSYNFTTASLSAAYQQRNNYSNLQDFKFNTNKWPYNTLGRAIILSANNSNVSAILPLSGNILHSFPISAWSSYIDNIQLTSVESNPITYTINAQFPDDTLNQRTIATYTFNYEPVVSEDLKISVLSSCETAEILRAVRQVNLTNTVEYVTPQYPIVWNLQTNRNSSFLTVSGIIPNDLENNTYYDYISGMRMNHLGTSYPYTALSGNVGLFSAVNLYTPTGIITGVDLVYGLDYIGISANNPDLSFTFSVSYFDNPFEGSVSAIDTHTFRMYSNPANIIISALEFDNDPFTRSLTAKAFNDKGGGNYVSLHPLNKVIWNLNEPDNDNSAVTALKLDGTTYDFQSYSDDTLVLKIQTSTFDLDTISPVLCSFTLLASAYDTYHTPTTFLTNTSYSFNVDTFPAESLFDSYLKLNFEDSKTTTGMWRLTSSSYVLTAEDVTTLTGNNVISGTRLISFGDGRTTNAQLTVVEFINPPITDYDIILLRTGVSASGWLSAHEIQSTIRLHFINRYLSANFVAYPTYVFVDENTQVVNTGVNTITSFGVSSYDVGHMEYFILSALDSSPAFVYTWSVNTNTILDILPTVNYGYNQATPTSGLPIKLEVYSQEMEYPMPDTYKDDNTGDVVAYPNKKTTDNSSILFQHLKLLPYENPVLTIDSYSNNLLLPTNLQVTATNSIVHPSAVPVVENVGISYWTLSTSKWTVNSNNTNLDYTLSLGNDDTVAGVIKYGATYPLVLLLTRRSYSSIPNTFPPYDWGTQEQITTSSINLTYSAAPELLFVPITRYGLTDTDIVFYNETMDNGLVSAFYINDGYSISSVLLTGFNDFTTSYPEEGTFNLNITGVLINGSIYTSTLNSAITILTGFQAFDDTVDRILGATILSLPHDLEEVKIPSNEWATAYNFNRSMNLLRDNLTYMQNMNKFYNLPPTSFFGWLGNITTDSNTFKWYNTNVSDYQGLSASQSNITLSAVSDIAYKHNKFYIADNTKIRILNSNITPTILNTIIQKTIGDDIGLAKRIGVDNTDRIYVLDSLKNRVLVFAPYSATSIYSNQFLFEWGRIGGPNAKYGFSTPNDLYIDSNDNIWIADTGNKAIKTYTRTGSWLQTIILDEITGLTPQTGGIISIAIDSEDNIHILTNTKAYKYTNSGVFITSYVYQNNNNEQPQKIIGMTGGGFMYICLETSIIKVLENGDFAGEFANDIDNSEYTSVYQNANNELLVANTKNILKYFDINTITRSTETAADAYMWTQTDLNVKADEDIQDFVINMRFKRMWDNINLFLHSLKGKIQYTTDALGNIEVEIVNFTPTEYALMQPIDKADIYIGINEICSSDVLNRCIRQLQTSMENLVTHI